MEARLWVTPGNRVITGYDASGNPIYDGRDNRLAASLAETGQDRMMVWKADLTLETPDIRNAVTDSRNRPGFAVPDGGKDGYHYSD